MAAVVVTPRHLPMPRHVWTHDTSHLPPQLATPSHVPRQPTADAPPDIFTASAPARMGARAKRQREDTDPVAPVVPPLKKTRGSPSKTKAVLKKEDSAAKQTKVAVEKEKAKLERQRAFEAQEREFREKYTRAFPAFTFHFDSLDTVTSSNLAHRVVALGAEVDTFFSKKVSHVITARPIPTLESAKASTGTQPGKLSASQSKRAEMDKENLGTRLSQSSQKSSQPLQLSQRRGISRPALVPLVRGNGNLVFDAKGPSFAQNDLLTKALNFGMKVWSVEKLISVLDRIQGPVSPQTQTVNLSHLLKEERLHGTRERDPATLRTEYTYFARGSYFVLMEDITGEHQPVMIKQYDRPSRGERPSWPVLYACKDASGPFSPGEDESSEEKPILEIFQEQSVALRPSMGQPAERHPAVVEKSARAPDLRKVLSLSNMTKRGLPPSALPVRTTHERDAYIAASGNSVNITSANATSVRSNTGLSLPGASVYSGNKQIQKRLHQHVLTNRLAQGITGEGETMGSHALRKSKSTNTMRLPMREESKKPGYCENCRIKFPDFSQHVKTKKHRAFAMSLDQFVSLDDVLERLKRPRACDTIDERLRQAESEAALTPELSYTEDDVDEEQQASMVTDEWSSALQSLLTGVHKTQAQTA